MVKLVVLSEGFAGKTCELKMGKTTIGRMKDNAFPIPKSSVSGRHCEVHLREGKVYIKDLGSTNGTFIAGKKVNSEMLLPPGKILRLGQVEIRLETGEKAGMSSDMEKTIVLKQAGRRTISRTIIREEKDADMPEMHKVDYRIYGEEMQFVEIELDPQEAVVAEAGGMMYMESGIEMETIFGDGSQQSSGFLGSLMSAGKRLLTGESLFMTVFLNRGANKQRVSFGAPYPGKIIPAHLADLGGELIAQKDSFLCAAKGVSVGIAFQKRLGAGLFGGEGFIMQHLQGDGWAFIHAGGTLYEKELYPGEMLRVDTGCVVAYQATVRFDIQYVGKIKSALFGGEGLFFATLRGPGKVWLQSLPLSRLAGRMMSAAGGGKGEGSLLQFRRLGGRQN